MAEFAKQGIEEWTLPWIGALGALVALSSALSFFFLRHLRRMVTSVSEGRPFDSVNADRLRHMAWLALAIWLVAIPLTNLAVWFDAMPHKPNVHRDTDLPSLGALLLALVLFVLARVFRAGAEMREELKGTV